MKKFIAIMLALMLLLCGCDQVTTPTTATGTQTGDQQQEAAACTHTDGNSDLTCDSCGESVLVTFEIYSVNDLHGKLTDGDNQPGVEEMTTFIKQRRAENENVLLFSAGDMWQGSSASNLTKGNLTTEWMNDIGFDAMVMGNHEYDWGGEFVSSPSWALTSIAAPPMSVLRTARLLPLLTETVFRSVSLVRSVIAIPPSHLIRYRTFTSRPATI